MTSVVRDTFRLLIQLKIYNSLENYDIMGGAEADYIESLNFMHVSKKDIPIKQMLQNISLEYKKTH